jgi:nucleotide-binding universal stress UspA family protein
MFTKAIVGFDGSERALDALALAESLISREGELVVCYARVQHGSKFSEAQRRHDPAEKLLSLARESVGGRVRVGCQRPIGRSTEIALKMAARDERADLIVLVSSHRGSVGRVLAGSVTEEVLHGSRYAVAVAPVGMRHRLTGGFAAIAVGVDGGPASTDVAKFAAALAGELEAKLRLVAVADLTSKLAASSSYALVYPAIVDARRAQARQTLDQVVKILPSELEVISEVYEGDPAQELLALSGGVDLLVLESRGRGMLKRLALGSVCGHVVRKAACPVLVLPAARPNEQAVSAWAPTSTGARPEGPVGST